MPTTRPEHYQQQQGSRLNEIVLNNYELYIEMILTLWSLIQKVLTRRVLTPKSLFLFYLKQVNTPPKIHDQ